MHTIVLQTVHFTASEKLEKFIREKIVHLFSAGFQDFRADVILFEGTPGYPRNCFCEIQLSVHGEKYYVKKNSESYEQSVLDSLDVLKKALKGQSRRIICR
jgi:putative sigma-54 modulation protein